MMDVPEYLREKNPGLKLYSVADREFAPYGQILSLGDVSELHSAMEKTSIPESGNQYLASAAVLEEVPLMQAVGHDVFGGMEIQCGCCNGHGHKLNALEYHKCSEVNFTTTGLVLLLALPSDMEDGRLSSAAVKGFYLPPDVPVEIYPRVLHFAPCRVREEGFNCLVVLEKGVNSPIDGIDTSAQGEKKLLWMRGKWMTCHKDSPQAEKGAFTGISGENTDLAI